MNRLCVGVAGAQALRQTMGGVDTHRTTEQTSLVAELQKLSDGTYRIEVCDDRVKFYKLDDRGLVTEAWNLRLDVLDAQAGPEWSIGEQNEARVDLWHNPTKTRLVLDDPRYFQETEYRQQIRAALERLVEVSAAEGDRAKRSNIVKTATATFTPGPRSRLGACRRGRW